MPETHPCRECGRLIPVGTKLCWSCAGETMRAGQGSELGCGVLTIGILLALYWFGYTFLYAPGTSSDNGLSREEEQSLSYAIWQEFPRAELRFYLQKGGNLNVYLERERFEDVPFPDRSSAVARIGEAWCANVEHTYLPALSIMDIRTGARLAKYSCVFETTSVSD